MKKRPNVRLKSEYSVFLVIKRKRQVICWIENHFKKIDNYIEN